jgi:predicted  nucleic acid-binding Zn-ribbon protein
MSEPEALLRLQDIDIRLMRLRATLSKMPQQIKLSMIARADRKLAMELTNICGQRKDAQMELDDNERRHDEVIKKIKAVQAEALERRQGFRETRDLEAHLSALAKQQEKLEHSYMEQAAALEKIEKAEKNAHGLRMKLQAEKKSQQDSFEQGSSDLRAEVRKLEAERAAAVSEITPAVMGRYEQASKRFGGLAVESLKGNVPSVCRVKLQPADFGDLKRQPEITECPYCHRILVSREALS